ncbi:MAG: peptide deformylase [Eubacterium sp.]|nr:peptide deformylase [Eubacterium sp.]
MALRNILKIGDDILRKKAREVTAFDDRLWTLLDDMYETLKEVNGAGLAAPQVGILKRVVVIDTGDGLMELINPVITMKKGKRYELEGCLSLPGQWGYVDRPDRVRVKAQNRYGKDQVFEGEGATAMAFCHEIDHLDGILFTDLAIEMADPEEVEEQEKKRKNKRRRS